jgi:hypothetical protein
MSVAILMLGANDDSLGASRQVIVKVEVYGQRTPRLLKVTSFQSKARIVARDKAWQKAILASSNEVIAASRISLVRRSCSVRHNLSTRPLPCAERAVIDKMPNSHITR